MLDKDKAQAFNDGIVKVYKLGGADGDGGMPSQTPELFATLRFRELSLTISRIYEANAVNLSIDRLIRVLDAPEIEADQIAVVTDRNGGEQYRIRSVQRIVQTTPKTLTLGLEKEGDHYEFEKN